MLRKALSIGGGLLVLLHAWIFAGQALQGELTDITLIGRWLLAGGLVWALTALRRRRISRVWSREAVAVWTLAALLHGPALLDRADTLNQLAEPDAAAALLQTTVGLVLIVVTALGCLGTRRAQTLLVRRDVVRHVPHGFASGGIVSVFSARPPPIA